MHINFIFANFTSLVSLADISKYNTRNLEILYSIFQDCPILLNSPNLPEWKNYDENNKNGELDYDIFN